MVSMNFNDQHIVLLGGSSGLGLATAQAAAAAGARVTVVSSREARVDAALAQLPASADGRVADLTDEAAVRDLFVAVGPFDHLAFTAGEPLQLGMLAETDVAAARATLDLRVWGAYTAVRHAAPLIRDGGSITLTGGTAAVRPQAGWTVGALICGAMESLTRALAVELAPLRVNLVRPGVIRTDLWSAVPEPDRAALFAQVAAGLPAGRVGEAADVAAAFLYLMDNRFATASVVTVDGGTGVA
jgi:NAD(P)-dependent dehydrogenase (short-subunit alcohol dehydrogenase family)